MDRTTGLISDQTVVLKDPRSAEHYPERLRRVRFQDEEKDEAWTYLTNDFDLPALTVADLYRSRWQVEPFFKWIKQHLRIKVNLYTFLQILSVYVFEKVPLPQLLTGATYTLESGHIRNQLWLFDL